MAAAFLSFGGKLMGNVKKKEGLGDMADGNREKVRGREQKRETGVKVNTFWKVAVAAGVN